MPPLLPLSRAHASAKPWDRHSPEWLGINAQVGDLFHGRSDTGGPRAYASPKPWERHSPEWPGTNAASSANASSYNISVGEALGAPFSRMARYKCSGSCSLLLPVVYGCSQSLGESRQEWL